MSQNRNKSVFQLLSMVILIVVLSPGLFASGPLTADNLLAIKTISEAEISPGGQWIAYLVSVPRAADDAPGRAYKELHLVSTKTGEKRPFIVGKQSISHIRWSPDGTKIAFITKRGDNSHNQVWMMPISGGEAVQVTRSGSGVSAFEWHPGEKKIAYIAKEPESKREKLLKKKGYDFIYYEENLKHKNLYLLDLGSKGKAKRLTRGITVQKFLFSPSGKRIAASCTPANLVDHRYMFQKIYLLDIQDGSLDRLTDNPGKLGEFAFSPDETRLVYTASLDRKDHAVSQVFVVEIASKKTHNLTIPDFKGHVNWAGWKDNRTVYYHSGEGVWSTLSLVPAAGGDRKILFHGKDAGFIFRKASFTMDFKHAALIGSTPQIPSDLYYWRPGKKALRLTGLNPGVEAAKLGKQEVIRYRARDNWEVEGLLIYPVNYQEGEKYPLVVFVHGGPESHYYNTWVSRYGTPGQVMAGKDYLIFYPNYRASTGYGVKFALAGYEDAAGKEFDDIADGIDYLVKTGLADPERVGLGGGSYGGYAAAWFATYYTDYVRAVSMFVGISDLISKRGTTDIPYEELYVHSGKKLEQMWQDSLERSPIYHAHKSKTAVLILGGTEDTRVHPSQSLEFYRRLKMNGHPAVRLVQYPGEGHGNRKQPGQIDMLYRIMGWYDWYVKKQKNLDDPMPPVDISNKYGIKLD